MTRPSPTLPDQPERPPAPPDLWRVYRPEWMIIHSADADIADGLFDKIFASKYEGRVKPEHVRRVTEGSGKYAIAHLQLKLPNMRGEFKHLEGAQAFVQQQGWIDAIIVSRNSRADHDLQAYGKRKLPVE